jgi:hypothetical protein
MLPQTVMRHEWEGAINDVRDLGFCDEKHRLLGEFFRAVHDLNELQTAQTKAIIDGDTDFLRFEVLLHVAQQKKEAAKYAWMEHVESHKCGEV